MSNENNRPAWAQGPEWEGWEREEDRVTRATKHNVTTFTIACDGYLAFDCDANGYERHICCGSPESALRIANAIAAEFGGWA